MVHPFSVMLALFYHVFLIPLGGKLLGFDLLRPLKYIPNGFCVTLNVENG